MIAAVTAAPIAEAFAAGFTGVFGLVFLVFGAFSGIAIFRRIIGA